ncbi:MAG TPA: patatin-like phospholipase family protein, partial [bacterium]|nr:patatin-like phospholipase family protein [bacterium]
MFFRNRKWALVLSGGGAKGIAHIGVLKFLDEHKLRPDMIAGTSAGAIIGSFYCCGMTALEIE